MRRNVLALDLNLFSFSKRNAEAEILLIRHEVISGSLIKSRMHFKITQKKEQRMPSLFFFIKSSS